MLKKLTKTIKQSTKKVKEITTKLIHGRNDLSPPVLKLLNNMEMFQLSALWLVVML